MTRFSTLLTLLPLAACSFADNGKVVLGRLGQATASTRIYASPNSRSRIFYRVKPKQYLVIRTGPSQAWDAVLLQNGVYGFVPSKAVEPLPYQVTTTVRNESRSMASASRSALNCGDSTISTMLNNAVSLSGAPYKFGGTDVNSGIDCSAFVQKMFGEIGVGLPRTAAEQVNVGKHIYRLEDLRAGDRLYFYEAKRGMIGHTGIYLGNGYFVHSSHGKGGVSTSYLDAGWRRILVAARR